jgi:hypothetical protein
MKTKITTYLCECYKVSAPYIISIFLFIVITGSLTAYGLWKVAQFVLNPVPTFEIATVNAKEIKDEKLPMKEWVMNEFLKNGLNTKVADCVINQESQWHDQSISPSREDFGLMQWHIQHVKSGFITPSCAFDYKCAVDRAIKKIKHDKGWSAWMGYADANCQRFGKSFN